MHKNRHISLKLSLPTNVYSTFARWLAINVYYFLRSCFMIRGYVKNDIFSLKGSTQVRAYFPSGRWYDYYDVSKRIVNFYLGC